MKNIKISIKLIILTIVSSSIIASVGIFLEMNAEKINAYTETIYHDRVVPFKQLKIVSDAYAISIVGVVQKYILGSLPRQVALNEMKEAKLKIDKYWNEYLETEIEGDELKLLNQAKKLKKETDIAYEEIVKLLNQKESSFSMEEFKNYAEKEMYEKIDPLTEKINELIEIQLYISKEIYLKSLKTYKNGKRQAYILIVLGIIAGMFISVFIISGINKSMKIANKSIKMLSTGDLSFDIPETGKDEIGVMLKNLNETIHKLREVYSGIITGADNILDAGNKLRTFSSEMSESAGEQASSTEEVSSVMQEMHANIQQNTNNAKQTEKIAESAAYEIHSGSKTVNETVEAMKTIADRISIISEIAFQTKILALNAAVEAARAGDEGKGFAVVAGQVKNLANRSKKAALEIDKVSANSVGIAFSAGKALKDLVPQIQKTAKLVQGITTANLEQNSSINQVTNAIEQLNRSTQHTTTVSKRVASSSEELSNQAEQLKRLISFFSLRNRNDLKAIAPNNGPENIFFTNNNKQNINENTVNDEMLYSF